MTNTKQDAEILGHEIARLTEAGIFAQQLMLEKNCKVSAKMR